MGLGWLDHQLKAEAITVAHFFLSHYINIAIMQEIWKDINDYEGSYQVSNYGNIRSLTRKVNKWDGEKTIKGQLIKQELNNSGYYKVSLYKSQKYKHFYIHRLIATHFISNPENKPCVNHINGIKADNMAENLEWCTRSENSKHAFKLGLLKCHLPSMKGVHGYNHQSSKPVLQYDLNGNFIREFPNAMEIKRELGFSNSYISSCCNERYKKAYGFIWKFKTLPSKA